jgi:GNAT superfamily N-acetyltransferase
MIEIRPIRAEETRSLRHSVLRPTQAPEQLEFSGDRLPQALHVGAFLGGRLVGIASVAPEACPGDAAISTWRLQGMAVVSEVQGRGCGRLLLERAIRHVAEHGGTLLWCEGRSNVAGFYRALGFEMVGEEFVKPITGPHYIMKKTIDPRGAQSSR